MDTFISNSPDETEALGAEWGGAAMPGWVIGLQGDLGAGKTCLVRGLARGLQIPGRVHSPTFSLVNEYEGGRLPLAHLDLYRLESERDLLTSGIEEHFYSPEGIVVVEWIERLLTWTTPGIKPDRCPARYRRVLMESLSEMRRRITYEDFGH